MTVLSPNPLTIQPSSDSTLGITVISSASLEATHVLKASAGSLYQASCLASSENGFLMVFNATSAPADGAVTPVHCIPVFAGGAVTIDHGIGPPDVFSTGISVAFSTTGPFTKTASATAFFTGRVK